MSCTDHLSKWHPVSEAPREVADAMSVCLTERGRYRGRFFIMHDGTFYLLWNGDSEGTPATLWCGPFDAPEMDGQEAF